MAINMAELMKGLMATQMASSNDAMNKDHSAPAVNQMMNMLSQEQAQKARQAEAMQKFLMQRQLHKEDFERKVELGKLLKGDINAEKLEKQREKIADNFSTMRKEEKPLYELHDYVTNQIDDIHRTIEALDSEAFHSAQKKIKNRMSTDNELRKRYESLVNGFLSKQNPSANDIDKIATEVNNLIKLGDFTDEETSSVNMIFNSIKGTTASILKNRGIKAGAQMMKTALSGKGSTFLQSPEALKQSFENLIPEFTGIYETSFTSRANALKKDPKKEYSITEMEDFNFSKFKQDDKNIIENALKEAMQSGESAFDAKEQKVYNEILRRGGTEEDALRTIEKYRGTK